MPHHRLQFSRCLCAVVRTRASSNGASRRVKRQNGAPQTNPEPPWVHPPTAGAAYKKYSAERRAGFRSSVPIRRATV